MRSMLFFTVVLCFFSCKEKSTTTATPAPTTFNYVCTTSFTGTGIAVGSSGSAGTKLLDRTTVDTLIAKDSNYVKAFTSSPAHYIAGDSSFDMHTTPDSFAMYKRSCSCTLFK